MRFSRWFVLASLVLALCMAAGRADADAGSVIKGRVMDASDGGPAAGFWVEIEELGLGTLTDSLGRFALSGLKPGTYHLSVTGVGKGTFRRSPELEIELLSDHVATVEIEFPGGKEEERDRDKQKINWFDGAATLAPPSVVVQRGDAMKESLAREPRSTVAPQYPGVVYGGRSELGKKMRQDSYSDEGYAWPRDMFFHDYGTNEWVSTRRDRLSTFGVDVDDASYNVVKGYLERGLLPPPEAIRLEEFVNHFDYGYNPPRDEKFRVFTELTPSPFDPDVTMLKLGIKAREVDRFGRAPLNLSLVIDESGSMAEGNRLDLVKRAVRALLGQLNHNDRVGIVAYNTQARVVLDPVAGDRGRELNQALDGLRPNGRTYAEAGIALGYRMAGRQFVSGHNNMVILFSDGVANVGRTGPDEIMDQIQRLARSGMSLHTYGVGMGNYNDVLLEQLAQMGDGHYAYINDDDDVKDLFVDGFLAATETLARDVKVQVEFDAKAVEAYRLLGYENRDVPDEHFRDNRQDGGEIGAGHQVTALYELKLGKTRRGAELGRVYVRWKDADAAEVTETSRTITLGEQFQPAPKSRPELRLAIAAARFSEILKGNCSDRDAYATLLDVAEPLQHELPGEGPSELVRLIRTARDLTGDPTPWMEDDYLSDNYRR